MRPEASADYYMGVLRAHNPDLEALLDASDEQDFMDAVETGLVRAFARMEAGAKGYHVLDERGLSRLLADLLCSAGFLATAETDHKGHVDVVVACAWGRGWVCLGECKIYGGYAYHVEGCEQLLGYCSGGQDRAFVIDFFKKKEMYKKLQDLLEKLNVDRPLEQVEDGVAHGKRAFRTAHDHVSGARVNLIHYGVNLYI